MSQWCGVQPKKARIRETSFSAVRIFQNAARLSISIDAAAPAFLKKGFGRRAQSVRGLPTAGRSACPAGYSGLSGRAAGAARRARTSRGCAPQRASQGEGRRPSPYVIPTSVWHGFFGRTPVRSVVNRQAASAPGIAAQPVKKPKACPAVRGAAD